MPLKNIIKTIVFILIIPLIQACGGGGSPPAVDTTLAVTVTIPSSITSAILPMPGTLRVYVNKQGDAPIEMTLSGNSATHTFTGLTGGISTTPATYEVTIEFDSSLYTSVITLESASNTVVVSSGSNSIAFVDSLFDLSVDSDSDSRNNLAEIVAGSNPLVPFVN